MKRNAPTTVSVAGSGIGNLAGEVAGKKVAKVYAVESSKLEPYTPDAFAYALKQFLSARQPRLVLMPHTYQVRDFAPKLATVLGRVLISDCVGYKYESGKLLFTRQMFQGKFAADVSFSGEPPWFVTFQNGAFRGDKVEAGASAAPVETAQVEIADGVVRNQPHETFKEAKQAVDLTQAEIIVAGKGVCRIGAQAVDLVLLQQFIPERFEQNGFIFFALCPKSGRNYSTGRNALAVRNRGQFVKASGRSFLSQYRIEGSVDDD